MSGAYAPGSVDAGLALRRALIGWGLGHALLGHRQLAAAMLSAELLALALVGALLATLGDTTWYLVPFVAGGAFIVIWAAQAVAAYRAAQRTQGAIPPTPRGSPATAAAWLTVPLLAWGTGFWLVAATAATPAAVLDRFVTAWPTGAERATWAELGTDPDRLERAAALALEGLRDRCAGGELGTDCGVAAANLLRGVRVRVVDDDGFRATAVAQLVQYERRPGSFLGLEVGTQLEAVPMADLLDFELEARPALVGGLDVGARRWTIVNARAP
ncbi:MAG: hypothetical protein ABI622_01545 [Chloroflexota bacterium]